MRFLLVLTALMLAVAAGVWWKTTQHDGAVPDALEVDPNLGAATFGVAPARSVKPPVKESNSAPASFSREESQPANAGAAMPEASAADAVTPGSLLTPAGGGDPKEPQAAANEKLAAAAAAAAKPVTPATYAVKDGDTLYRIVLRAYGTAPEELVDAVAKANGLRDPSQISVGQAIKLPSLAGWPTPKKL